MRSIPLISAYFLAAIFLYAGVDKLLHYGGFINALASYVLVPAGASAFMAPTVIAAELAVGLGLLWRAWRRQAAGIGAALLGLFTIALAVNQVVAPGSVCGCWFTVTLAKSNSMHIAQNLVLAGLALTLWWEARGAGRTEGIASLAPLAAGKG